VPATDGIDRFPAVGDEQVAPALSQDTRFRVVTVLSSERRETLEFGPRQQRLQREGHACYRWTSGSEAFAECQVPTHPASIRPQDVVAAARCDVVAGTLVIAIVAKQVSNAPPTASTHTGS
jgi:hypothetical protein